MRFQDPDFLERSFLCSPLGFPILAAMGSAITRPIVGGARTSRNDDCPCGSRKKFKKCCGAEGRRRNEVFSSEEIGFLGWHHGFSSLGLD